MPSACPVKRRRDQYTEATRAALLDAATESFARKGYARTALADVAAAAQVTRGAVYHHFADKQALFEAVLERLELDAVAAVTAATARKADPWTAAMRGIAVFLDRCTDPTYGQIVWHEGPRALGMPHWREVEYRYNYGLVEQMVRRLTATGDLEPAPLVPTSRLIFHLLGEAGMAVAEAEPGDQAVVRHEYEGVLRRILEGLRPTPTTQA